MQAENVDAVLARELQDGRQVLRRLDLDGVARPDVMPREGGFAVHPEVGFLDALAAHQVAQFAAGLAFARDDFVGAAGALPDLEDERWSTEDGPGLGVEAQDPFLG